MAYVWVCLIAIGGDCFPDLALNIIPNKVNVGFQLGEVPGNYKQSKADPS